MDCIAFEKSLSHNLLTSPSSIALAPPYNKPIVPSIKVVPASTAPLAIPAPN